MAPNKKNQSKHVEVDGSVDRDELAVLLNNELNSRKDGIRVAHFIDQEGSPSEITEWVSSGSTMLDLAISNRPNGGFPVGKVCELSGLEGTGKSLFCASLIRQTQLKGGLSVFFDSEFAVDRAYWNALGINVKNVNYVPFVTLEELFDSIEKCIGAFRKACKDRLLTIFIDSIAQASNEAEMESSHGTSGFGTEKAKMLSKAFRKITGLIAKERILIVFTNQLRYNMNAGPFGDKWVSPGGKALPFAASVRVRLANIGKIKRGEDIIGMSVKAQVIKNRCGPNFRSAQFEVHYDSGIQDVSSWLSFLKKSSIITGDGRGYKYQRDNGEQTTFNTQQFVELMKTDLALRDEIYKKICDNYIMIYRDPNSKIVEDAEVVDGENDDLGNAQADE